MNRKNHVEANTDQIIRRATVLNEATALNKVIDLNVLITVEEVILAEDAERKSIILEAEEMLSGNGIKGICGSIDAIAKH